jgi:hypothetical protein
MKKRAFGGIAVTLGSAFVLGWSTQANAQQFLANRDVANGPGYQAGDFDIHPGLAAEIGYDSNYFGRSDKTDSHYVNAAPQNPPAGTGLLQVTPSLRIATSPATGTERPSVSLSAGASGTYREFFSSAVSNQRNMSGTADATLGILPGRAWNGSLTATWTRLIQPTVLGNPDQSYNNDTIVASADLATQPNEGTLDWHFGFQFTGVFFEQSAGSPYNNNTYLGYTRGRWRFRPRTALIYDGSISTRIYQNANGAVFDEHTATPVRARIGLEGLVTSRFSVLGLIGYGATFASGNANDPSVQQYDSVIGQLELRFFPTTPRTDLQSKPTLLVSSVALGYTRDFVTSYFSTAYGLDRGYLRAEYFYAGRFLVTLEGGVGAYEYPNLYFAREAGLNPTTGQAQLMTNAYTDVRADATLFTEYRVLPSIGINGTLSYTENFSSTQLPVTVADISTRANLYDMSWRRYQAFIGVRWLM